MSVVNGVPVIMPPPEGYVVDFDNPTQRSATAGYWIAGVGNALMLIFMLQRVYVRVSIHRSVKLEDAFLGVAYAFSVALQALAIRDFSRGVIGVHAWEMPIPKFVAFARALYLLPIIYNPIQCGAKMALLLVYRRLAPAKWFQWLVRFTMFVTVGSSVAITFGTIFPCKPTKASWDPTILDAKCIDRNALYKATAALGAITDAMVLAVPIPVVIPLQIPRRQKIGLLAFFGVGGITVFTSIMRLITIMNSMTTADQSWGCSPALLWIITESNLSVICATLPTIKPFIRKVSPYLISSADSRSRTNKSGPVMSNPNAPATFGSSAVPPVARGNDGYERFDDTTPMFPLKTMANVEATPKEADPEKQAGGGSKWSSPSHGRSASHADAAHNDWGSETAIVQTRTTTVEYSKRE